MAGWLALVSIAMLYVGVKLTGYWLKTENDDVMGILKTLLSVGKIGLGTILLYELGPMFGNWLTSAVRYVTTGVQAL